jgi:DegV family protein with EDD domain
MEYQIITDSCTDFDEELPDSLGEISRVPFKIMVDNKEMEDKNLDISSLINQMQSSISRISTACPSPYDFYSAFKKSTENFVVTISSKLSGSFQSALVAMGMMEEDNQPHTVHVIDSKSASAGQTLVVLKLKKLLGQSLDHEQVVQRIGCVKRSSQFRGSMK